MVWDTKTDSFGFAVPPDPVVTKRVIFSLLSRLYDPLGLCEPFVMSAKIIIQDAWIPNLEWDQEVPPDLRRRFRQWLSELPAVRQWTIPRSFVALPWGNASCNIERHAFGDASERGYGTVVYCVFIVFLFMCHWLCQRPELQQSRRCLFRECQMFHVLGFPGGFVVDQRIQFSMEDFCGQQG
jgi:hypothetical protein